MNSESLPYSNFEAQRDAEIMSQMDTEQQKRNGGASSNGPIIGMALMASIALPLVCMAAMRMRSNMEAGAATTAGSVTTPAIAVAPTPQYIYWNYNFDAAKQLAIAGNKSMMIDFYTDWCPSCKSLDAQVYTQSAIVAEAQNIIPLKVNAEGQTDLAAKYNITKYPTIIWTDSQGNEKFRQVGWTSAYDFYQTMQQNR